MGDEQSTAENNDDSNALEELEGASFDELLESIDTDNEIDENDLDSDIDIEALLDESPQAENIQQDLSQDDATEEDFLDVAALLDESNSSEPDEEKELDLDMSLEPFVADEDDLQMIDVDADDGIGAKLDLAHAYIEIGEEESARELLAEVIQKGNQEQIDAANGILDKLS